MAKKVGKTILSVLLAFGTLAGGVALIARCAEDETCTHETQETLSAVSATCTENGKTAGKVCVDCGEILVEQETILAKGHTEKNVEAVSPTCTEDGKTAGKVCTDCGEVIVAQETVVVTGHEYVDGVCIHCENTIEIEHFSLTINGKMVQKIGEVGQFFPVIQGSKTLSETAVTPEIGMLYYDIFTHILYNWSGMSYVVQAEYQQKYDNVLETEDKTVSGAINELNENKSDTVYKHLIRIKFIDSYGKVIETWTEFYKSDNTTYTKVSDILSFVNSQNPLCFTVMNESGAFGFATLTTSTEENFYLYGSIDGVIVGGCVDKDVIQSVAHVCMKI